METLQNGDKIKVLESAYTDECNLIGRTGIVTRVDFHPSKVPDVPLYYVELDGEDEEAGEWLMAHFELEKGLN